MLYKDTLTLDDALRISGPMAFNIMIKPAGSLCNLDCHYCYYLDKAEIYGGYEPRMKPVSGNILLQMMSRKSLSTGTAENLW